MDFEYWHGRRRRCFSRFQWACLIGVTVGSAAIGAASYALGRGLALAAFTAFTGPVVTAGAYIAFNRSDDRLRRRLREWDLE